MEVLVFYTNIKDLRDVSNASAAMTAIPDISRWTIDIDDCDKVLRVLALSDISQQVQHVLFKNGYTCNRMQC